MLPEPFAALLKSRSPSPLAQRFALQYIMAQAEALKRSQPKKPAENSDQ